MSGSVAGPAGCILPKTRVEKTGIGLGCRCAAMSGDFASGDQRAEGLL